MFSKIRRHISYTNAILTLALVFAMAGGAYAAKKYVITSTSQISPKVLKSLQGKAGANGTPGAQGPAGAAGPAGPAGPGGAKGNDGSPGAKGENGAPGAPGDKGANGESVTSKAFSGAKTVGSQKCDVGGTEFISAAGTTLACNGEAGEAGEKGKNGTPGATGPKGVEGEPWTTGGVLPSKQSEKGVWSLAGMPVKVSNVAPLSFVSSSISFPIPLKEGLTGEVGKVIGFEEGEGETNEKLPEVGGVKVCTGNHDNPKAAPGYLCIFVGPTKLENVFQGTEGPVLFPISLEVNKAFEVSRTGVLMQAWAANEAEGVYAAGAWAVTAP